MRALAAEELLKTGWVESNDHLIVNHDSGRLPALVFAHQLAHGGEVVLHVAYLVFESSRREEGLCRVAWPSTGQRENDNFAS